MKINHMKKKLIQIKMNKILINKFNRNNNNKKKQKQKMSNYKNNN